jgi:hypothetical protein
MQFGAAEVALGLGVGLLLLASWFAWRQILERRGRTAPLPPEDARFYAHKDARRLSGSIVMGLIAVGLIGGTRLATPPGDREAGRFYVAWWSGVGFLLLILWLLAVWDIVANLHFAHRLRSRLIADRKQWLGEVASRYERDSAESGQISDSGDYSDANGR